MNYRIISFVLAKVLKILSIFLLFPTLCSVIYKENFNITLSFIYTIIITILISYIFLFLANQKQMKKNFYTKEGLVIVAITWIIYSLLGSLPFIFSNSITNFIDAFFETVSGFTTTGSSIINDIEILPKSILFWRSMTHFIGGMGVIVFALAVLPHSPHNIHIMKAEVAGPMFGKVVSSIKNTAIYLYSIYIGLSIIMFILLMFSGIGIFESINLTFSTAGTGGFSTKNSGISYYNNDYVTSIITIFMIIFSLNLNLIYIIIVKKYFKALKNEELKLFLIIILLATIAIFINIYYTANLPNERLLDVLFTVSSIISTTGFTYLDFSNWTMFSQIIILFLMICGGAGGTAGGLKIPRIMFMIKNTKNYIKKCINPNKVISLKIDNKVINDTSEISNYIVLYIIVFSIFSILLSFQLNDFEEVFSAILTTLNNVGPGFNKFGPMENFSSIPYFSKIILSMSMLLGRLEIIPFIVLLSSQTWRKKRAKQKRV
ncbi:MULTISPECIES: TrkH family potassium uptake protein [unclassified Gemella]|uniref:TrkH family potassium uptake protein n=1 Tax=unclassified Gemella TaxID=2624949 RepID=UPI001C0542A5|nr:MULTISPECIES: TrkH family potassium uptake protein [unclassified Gemella]MBU0278026.1 TrkH family potassium uptake protein [Gemella sp. zg-1178]QWQ38444.1 TrkH family potassium uptake protein [Gemella sp. zg-570]